MNIKELYWAAGFIEGEGSFGYYVTSPRISIAAVTKDRFNLARVQHLFGGTIRSRKYYGKSAKKSWSPVSLLTLYGLRAVEAMMTLYSLMGNRRKRQIRKVLETWRKVSRRSCNKGRINNLGHPERSTV